MSEGRSEGLEEPADLPGFQDGGPQVGPASPEGAAYRRDLGPDRRAIRPGLDREQSYDLTVDVGRCLVERGEHVGQILLGRGGVLAGRLRLRDKVGERLFDAAQFVDGRLLGITDDGEPDLGTDED